MRTVVARCGAMHADGLQLFATVDASQPAALRKIPASSIPLSAFLGVCGISKERFEQIRRETKTCAASDSCVLAGSAQCSCSDAVNASKAAEFNDAAKSVECRGAMVDCGPPLDDLGCQDGQCIGAPSLRQSLHRERRQLLREWPRNAAMASPCEFASEAVRWG